MNRLQGPIEDPTPLTIECRLRPHDVACERQVRSEKDQVLFCRLDVAMAMDLRTNRHVTSPEKDGVAVVLVASSLQSNLAIGKIVNNEEFHFVLGSPFYGEFMVNIQRTSFAGSRGAECSAIRNHEINRPAGLLGKLRKRHPQFPALRMQDKRS